MNGSMFRVIVIILILGLIYFGLRRIWRDWSGRFRELDKAQRDQDLAKRQRDLAERQRPDVIDLKRDKDGKFRPGGRDDADRS
ncbi:hypothetical protein SAMN02983003_3259 [Devosia enhydra]|uniref:Uncharacterized protein n=1 Tax=Devosia enhydra TaxID=665118 RepID=A0A1K2I117_9HYPH|nr:hypothetical protein [Devosia enhydra]SFZ86085.1 hypothetical protein SAMN02983003_3259 [Devosia enhydra]